MCVGRKRGRAAEKSKSGGRIGVKEMDRARQNGKKTRRQCGTRLMIREHEEVNVR